MKRLALLTASLLLTGCGSTATADRPGDTEMGGSAGWSGHASTGGSSQGSEAPMGGASGTIAIGGAHTGGAQVGGAAGAVPIGGAHVGGANVGGSTLIAGSSGSAGAIDCPGTIVASAAQCMVDDAHCYQLADGRYCTGSGALPRACSTTDVQRTVTAELKIPNTLSAPTIVALAMSGEAEYLVDGTLRSVSETPDGSALSIAIEDTQGSVWTLAVSPRGNVTTWQTLTQRLIGSRVTLMYRYRGAYQSPQSAGFVLANAEGLLIAAELGPWVKVLEAADIPGISVALGAVICSKTTMCATYEYKLLDVEGTTKVSVGLDLDGEFTANGKTYVARNSGAAALSRIICKDVEQASKWAIWRKAE